jgi:hypothetical protein
MASLDARRGNPRSGRPLDARLPPGRRRLHPAAQDRQRPTESGGLPPDGQSALAGSLFGSVPLQQLARCRDEPCPHGGGRQDLHLPAEPGQPVHGGRLMLEGQRDVPESALVGGRRRVQCSPHGVAEHFGERRDRIWRRLDQYFDLRPAAYERGRPTIPERRQVEPRRPAKWRRQRARRCDAPDAEDRGVVTRPSGQITRVVSS